MPKISINGRTITVVGTNSIVIGRTNGGEVFINGQKIIFESDERIINIQIDGNVDSLEVQSCDKVNLNGDTGSVHIESGNLECQKVQGNVKAESGNVRCGDVTGNVKTEAGNITCGQVNGYVKATCGNIRHS